MELGRVSLVNRRLFVCCRHQSGMVLKMKEAGMETIYDKGALGEVFIVFVQDGYPILLAREVVVVGIGRVGRLQKRMAPILGRTT